MTDKPSDTNAWTRKPCCCNSRRTSHIQLSNVSTFNAVSVPHPYQATLIANLKKSNNRNHSRKDQNEPLLFLREQSDVLKNQHSFCKLVLSVLSTSEFSFSVRSQLHFLINVDLKRKNFRSPMFQEIFIFNLPRRMIEIHGKVSVPPFQFSSFPLGRAYRFPAEFLQRFCS